MDFLNSLPDLKLEKAGLTNPIQNNIRGVGRKIENYEEIIRL